MSMYFIKLIKRIDFKDETWLNSGMANSYELWFDGACGPQNPGGVGAIGFILHTNGQFVCSGKGVIGSGQLMSNNVAEYRALHEGLKAFLSVQPERGSHLSIYGDSDLVVKQLTHKWRAWPTGLYYVAYVPTAHLLSGFKERGFSWSIKWIPREQNQPADDLSKAHNEKT